MLFLFGIGLLYSGTGSLNIADNIIKLRSLNPKFIITIIILFIPMLLVETEIIPFNFWVPGAYQKSSSNFAAVLSGIFLTAGIYIFIRIFIMFFGNVLDETYLHKIKIILFLLAGLSFMLGEIAAYSSKNIKKILAYSSIGQAGLILSGLLMVNKTAVWGAMFLLLAHIIAKSLMFFITSFFVKSTQTSNYKNLTGIGRTYPFLGFGFTIGALSLSGMPLFAGFWGKFSLIKGIVSNISNQPKLFYLAILFLGIGIIVETVYLLRLSHKLFEKPKNEFKGKVPILLKVTVLILVLILVILGVYPQIITSCISGMSNEVFNIKEYINIIL